MTSEQENGSEEQQREITEDTRESAVNTIAEMVFEGHDGLVDPDQPDDAMLQIIRGASDICEAHGIPEGKRVDVIVDGVREGLVRKIDESMQDLKFQLEVFSGL